MQDFNTRIASRADTKQNWELNNPILLQGEIAIVFDGNNQLFKVGDGQNHFNDLQYSFYDQFASEQINTSNLRAKSISQGYGSNVNGIGGIATGYKSQVSSNFAQSHGYQANVSSDFGYVWNGDNQISDYSDHGNGTFNINPKNGISGIYIGDINLKDTIENVNYPLDNPTASSETVDDVAYRRFDIKDHTIATITLSDETPVRIHFPDKPTENFCRDFIVKIKVTSVNIPQVQFVKGQNDTSIGFEYEDDSWAVLDVGINYFTFTETERE